MAEKGKITRALRKSGAAAGGTSRPDQGADAPQTVAGSEAPKAPFRRVEGRCGQPDPTVVLVHDKWGEAATQFRAVRSKLLAMNEGEPPRVLTITSGTRKEGKTTVSLNLAAALCEVTKGRVVVVDGDPRGPGVHLLANAEVDKDMFDILQGEKLSLDDAVYETAVPGLDIIPACNITELDGQAGLLANRCEALLSELRRFYSFIIVDTPPVIASSEACTFGLHSDGALLVARLEKTSREVTKRAAEELQHSGTKILGCILTHRQHHVPGAIYRLVGHTPQYYYQNYRKPGRKKQKEQGEDAPAQSPG